MSEPPIPPRYCLGAAPSSAARCGAERSGGRELRGAAAKQWPGVGGWGGGGWGSGGGPGWGGPKPLPAPQRSAAAHNWERVQSLPV